MMEICRQNYVMTTIGYERERNLINKDGFDSKRQTRSPRGGVIEKQEVYGAEGTFPRK